MNPKLHLLILIICNLIILNLQSSSHAQYTDNFAASFNGTSSYISTPSQFDVSPSSAITLEAWIFPTTLPTSSACILGKNYLTGYYFGIENSGRFIFFPKPGLFLRSRVSGIVKINQWNHIAATYDGVSTRLYLNGVQDTSTEFAIYGGDVNQDGVVDATDAGAVDNDAFAFVTGYVNTDVTGDDIVDATDAALVDNNAFNFVTKITP